MNKKIRLIVTILGVILLGLIVLLIINKKGPNKIIGKGEKLRETAIELKTETATHKLSSPTEKNLRLPIKESPEDKEILELIEKLKTGDFSIRQEAADKLVSLGKKVIPKLSELLKDASVGLKAEIIFMLGRIGDKEATPILLEALQDENSYVKRNASVALGKIKDNTAAFALATSLYDGDSSVRSSAAWALGEIKDHGVVEDLIHHLIDEEEEGVETAIVKTFAKLEDQRATPILLGELKFQADPLYKNEVVTSLGEIGDPRALSELIEHLNILKKHKPTEKILIFQWEQAVKITEEAIQKIQQNK